MIPLCLFRFHYSVVVVLILLANVSLYIVCYQWKETRICKLKTLSSNLSFWRYFLASNIGTIIHRAPSFGAFIDPFPWPIIHVLTPCLAFRRLWPSWLRTRVHSPSPRASSTPNWTRLFLVFTPWKQLHLFVHCGPHLLVWTLRFLTSTGLMPCLWIFKISQIFYYHGTPDNERLQVASFYLSYDI